MNTEKNTVKFPQNLCAFPQSFHTKKSGEITVFFAVEYINTDEEPTYPQSLQ